MRQVILDTETTGLDYRNGDRVIEIGCIEMTGRKLTQRRFHSYLNPQREIEAGAMAVHGISNEFLLDKPKFAEIANDFIEFVRDAELVIHNAAFDLGFLNHELSLLNLPPLDQCCTGVIDTLKLARELHPGRKNSLDALCDRYTVSNAHRTLHGALLDAELLAEVYLAMTRGQESLIIDLGQATAQEESLQPRGERPALLVLPADAADLAEHERVLAQIDKESKGRCLWLN